MRDRCKHEENCGCTYKCAEYEPISSNAVLSEVRALKQQESELPSPHDPADVYNDGYNQAIDDVLKKISEHFS